MTKRQLIDEIITINRSARPSFLAEFEDHDLSEYLDHLLAVCGPRPQGDPWWPQRHLKDRPATPPAAATETPPRRRAVHTDDTEDDPLSDADAALDDDAIDSPGQPVLAGAGSAPARRRAASRLRQTSGNWLF